MLNLRDKFKLNATNCITDSSSMESMNSKRKKLLLNLRNEEKDVFIRTSDFESANINWEKFNKLLV
jgi:hypothetical protein